MTSTNTTKTITLSISADELTGKAVTNAVRRALANVENVEGSGEIKGVKFAVKENKAKETTQAAVIREWARKTGVPVGKRGRIKPELVVAYNEAHKAPKARKPRAKASV